MRILVVEDDRDLSRQLAAALGEAHYTVDVAYDGEEGHFLGDTESYDAIILDLGLPGHGPRDAAAALRHALRRQQRAGRCADPGNAETRRDCRSWH